MAHRVADELVSRLVEAGVERIYGVVGDSLNPVTDAIRLNGKLKWIHVRNEESGAFAAGAEAQLSGKLAACAGSCGPGNLHLINGLFDAHRSNAPVLAIASHIPTSEIGTGYFQETHPEILFKECSHYCESEAVRACLAHRHAECSRRRWSGCDRVTGRCGRDGHAGRSLPSLPGRSQADRPPR